MAKKLNSEISLEFMRLVGENIKKKRLKKGWTLEQLGLEIGLTKNKVHRIESGYNITLETILKIALALEVKPDTIIKVDFEGKKEHLEGLIESSKSNKTKPSK